MAHVTYFRFQAKPGERAAYGANWERLKAVKARGTTRLTFSAPRSETRLNEGRVDPFCRRSLYARPDWDIRPPGGIATFRPRRVAVSAAC